MTLFIIMLLSGLATFVYAQPLSSAELINNAKRYDGKTVVYEGEVVGDIMKRSDGAWLSINDTKAALGVFCPPVLTKDINYIGGYKTKGDWVRIEGVFHRACPIHGGDLDIHAQALSIITGGGSIHQEVPLAKKIFSVCLSGAVICLLILQSLNLTRKAKSKR
ncbi:MAG: DNA-binding protein [Candidatus Omnitrophota bacterium]